MTNEGSKGNVGGDVTFTPEEINGECKARIKGGVTGLGKKGSKDSTKHHGWHIHERGDVTDPLRMETAGRCNPEEVGYDLPEKNGKKKYEGPWW